MVEQATTYLLQFCPVVVCSRGSKGCIARSRDGGIAAAPASNVKVGVGGSAGRVTGGARATVPAGRQWWERWGGSGVQKFVLQARQRSLQSSLP